MRAKLNRVHGNVWAAHIFFVQKFGRAFTRPHFVT
jgi:hypothetical protein